MTASRPHFYFVLIGRPADVLLTDGGRLPKPRRYRVCLSRFNAAEARSLLAAVQAQGNNDGTFTNNEDKEEAHPSPASRLAARDVCLSVHVTAFYFRYLRRCRLC
ncbi:hypothetical protein IOCL1545_000062500 [Leishmania shawi]|uniref:Uncharacterized protein n=1 Tax=Leishmania shawi TaxID=5680 RepID=A0ABR3EHF4_9TRYP